MSRLRAVGRWLLACWPLAMRSTLEQSERALMSVVGELERQGEHLERALADQDAIAVERDDLAARLRVAERQLDRAQAGLIKARREMRERATSVTQRADAVLAAIDEAVAL